jgi:hypothetical protein
MFHTKMDLFDKNVAQYVNLTDSLASALKVALLANGVVQRAPRKCGK